MFEINMGSLTIIIIVVLALIVFLTIYYKFMRSEKNMEKKKPDMEFSEEIGINSNMYKTVEEDSESIDPANYNWEEQELKNKYNKNLIRLMVKDPGWLYTYWEITNPEFYENKAILRLFLEDENKYYDISISHQATDWYICHVKPDSPFKVAIGYLKDGIFKPLCFSRTVTTPRNKPSDNLDLKWLYIEELSRYSYRIDINSTLSLIKSLEKRRQKENISSLSLLERE